MPEIKVTLKRSLIGVRRKQKEAVRCLGLRKINKSRVFKDTPALRGQIEVVKHLIFVEEGTFQKKEAQKNRKQAQQSKKEVQQSKKEVQQNKKEVQQGTKQSTKDKVLKKSVSKKTKGDK